MINKLNREDGQISVMLCITVIFGMLKYSSKELRRGLVSLKREKQTGLCSYYIL